MFNPGDKVICIDASGLGKDPPIKKGCKYTVNNLDTSLVYLEELSGPYYSYRFELAYIKEFNDKMEKLINDE